MNTWVKVKKYSLNFGPTGAGVIWLYGEDKSVIGSIRPGPPEKALEHMHYIEYALIHEDPVWAGVNEDGAVTGLSTSREPVGEGENA